MNFPTLVAFASLAFHSFSAPEVSPVVFRVDTTSAAEISGPLEELAADWSLRFGGKEQKRVAAGELVGFTRVGFARPRPPSGPQLIFANGDRIAAGRGLKLVGEKVTFTPDFAGAQEVTISLSPLAAIWLRAPDGTAYPEVLRGELPSPGRKRDAVRLANGDVLEGILSSIDNAVHLEVDRKPVKVEIAKVAFIALSADAAPRRPKGPFGRIVLADGSRITVTSASCPDGRSLSLATQWGATLPVPVEEVVSLSIHGGPAVYLSDLKPERSEYTPYSGERWLWPLVNDANVRRGALRIAGSTYDKGVGLHSGSRITYALNGSYRRFEALVGLDDVVGREGSVRIRLLLDGKARDIGLDRELTVRDGAIPIHVDVTKARELTLLVDFGAGGDAAGCVNWAEARLVR